jgi:hypothetical protein
VVDLVEAEEVVEEAVALEVLAVVVLVVAEAEEVGNVVANL